MMGPSILVAVTVFVMGCSVLPDSQERPPVSPEPPERPTCCRDSFGALRPPVHQERSHSPDPSLLGPDLKSTDQPQDDVSTIRPE